MYSHIRVKSNIYFTNIHVPPQKKTKRNDDVIVFNSPEPNTYLYPKRFKQNNPQNFYLKNQK